MKLANGRLLGCIEPYGNCNLNYKLKDDANNELCTIKGPRAYPSREDEFVMVVTEEKVNMYGELSSQENPIGVISGIWDTQIPQKVGFIKKHTTGMEVPKDATVTLKSLAMAAMFAVVCKNNNFT